MGTQVKTGKEIVAEYFKEIQELPGVDKEIIALITSLFNQDKLSDKNITNGLQALRNKNANKN